MGIYTPYLYSKIFELTAIKELLEKNIIDKQYVIPIIDTYSVRGLNKVVDLFIKKEYPLFFVLNPSFELENENDIKKFEEIKELALQDNSIIPSYYLSPKSSEDYIQNQLLNINKDIALIHGNLLSPKVENTVNKYTGKNIYRIYVDNNMEQENNFDIEIVDGFVKKEKTDDYDEFSQFSTRLFNFEKRGLYGFGDYLTIGRKIIKGGTLPNYVVINITYKEQDMNRLNIRHFSSKEADEDSKLTLLLKYQNVYKIIYDEVTNNPSKYRTTLGLTSLLDSRDHFPGLGKLKQFSIMHHIELIQTELIARHIKEE